MRREDGSDRAFRPDRGVDVVGQSADPTRDDGNAADEHEPRANARERPLERAYGRTAALQPTPYTPPGVRVPLDGMERGVLLLAAPDIDRGSQRVGRARRSSMHSRASAKRHRAFFASRSPSGGFETTRPAPDVRRGCFHRAHLASASRPRPRMPRPAAVRWSRGGLLLSSKCRRASSATPSALPRVVARRG